MRAKLSSFHLDQEWTPGTTIPQDLVTEILAKLDAISRHKEGVLPNTALDAAPAGKPKPISIGAVLGATFLGATSAQSGAFTARAVLSTTGAGSSATSSSSSSALGATSPSPNTALTVPPVPPAVHSVLLDAKVTTGTKRPSAPYLDAKVTTGTKRPSAPYLDAKVTTGTKRPSAPYLDAKLTIGTKRPSARAQDGAKDDTSPPPPPPNAPQTALFESALHAFEAQGASRSIGGALHAFEAQVASRGEPGIGGPAPVVMPQLGEDLVGSMLQEADAANFYAEFEAELEA